MGKGTDELEGYTTPNKGYFARAISFLVLFSVLVGCGSAQVTSAPTPHPSPSPAITPTPAPTAVLIAEQSPTPPSSTPAIIRISTPNPPSPTSASTSKKVESGSVAVYYQASLRGGTTYHTVEGQTLVMKGSGGGVFRYLPELDNVTLVEDYVSPSFARNVLYPYTVDGRLFLVHIWPDSRSADFDEFASTGASRLSGKAASVSSNSDYSDWSNYAVVNNRLYYQTKRRSDVFAQGGYSGGLLMVAELGSDARAKVLLWHDDPANYGSVESVGGDLYRIGIAVEPHLVNINRIDLATGAITRGLEFQMDNSRDYKNWEIALDEDAVYFAGRKKGAPVIELWRLSRIDVENANISNMELVHSQTLEDERDGLLGLDADGGYVAVELSTWGKGSFILYGHTAGSATTIKPGHDPRSVEVMKVR